MNVTYKPLVPITEALNLFIIIIIIIIIIINIKRVNVNAQVQSWFCYILAVCNVHFLTICSSFIYIEHVCWHVSS